ncbi:hypothetical protein LOTGIDRAFT_115411 [Lottia gigantea]|uniref:Band 7 domain-containing protein n=1 Tax=Lottia gigantea TaxID=225164 RepID=V4AIW0_LOTGI|nr:hypothetical protein LOTGIDRAFT_115411 [Lottia gigantea]ESO96962.1 hypothetical protein LOTGIDRAFT_115411 [Lottia gigantea]
MNVQDINFVSCENEDSSGLFFCLTILPYFFDMVAIPLLLCICIKAVQEYERAANNYLVCDISIHWLRTLTLSGGAKGPYILPCIEQYTKFDLRTKLFDISLQEVLTRDISVDAEVYCKISNPTVAVVDVQNAAHSTQLLAQTTLRNVFGSKN